jgi:hypothetical protein
MERYEQVPSAFPLMPACEIAIIATILRYWVFVRPSLSDQLSVLSLWEDEEFDDHDALSLPESVASERVIERCLGGDPAWEEVESDRILGYAMTHVPLNHIHLSDPGHDLADHHASAAEIEDELASLAGIRIDQQALADARGQLRSISSMNEQRRGKEFERVLAVALRAHGCTVELGKSIGGEQIDLFMSDPQIAIIECRWTKDPLETADVDVLVRKAERRPPTCYGLYVSMSGFTKGAQSAARDARDRAIFLMAKPEIEDLFAGTRHFTEFWHEQVQASLRRY